MRRAHRLLLVPCLAAALLAIEPADLVAQYDAELAAELAGDFYWVLDAEGRIVTAGVAEIAPIPRSGRDTPMPVDPHLRDPRGTAVSQTTVMGLILVCKTYSRLAGAMAESFDATRTGGLTDKRERLAAIEAAALELADLDKAASILELSYSNLLRGMTGIRGNIRQEDLADLTKKLEDLRQSSGAARQAFTNRRNELAGSYPELAVHVDGVPLWEAMAELDTSAVPTESDDSDGVADWLYERFTDVLAEAFDQGEEVPEAARMEIYNAYLAAGRDVMLEQTSDCHKKVADLWKYGSAGYQSTRDAIRRHGEDMGAEIPGLLMDELEGVYAGYETHQKVDEGWKDIVMATAGALLIPLGPIVCAGYGVIEIVKEGSEVVVTYHSLEDARARAPIEGYRHVVSEEERLAAEVGDLAFTAITVAPDFLDGVRAVRIVRPADEACTTARATENAADAAPSTGGAGAADDAASGANDAPPAVPERSADADGVPETGDSGAGVGDETVIEEMEIPPREPGARPMEDVADDPEFLDVATPRSLDEDALDDLEDAIDRARREGVPEDQIEEAVGDVNRDPDGDLSDGDLTEAAERVETQILARTGCIVVEEAPVRELGEIYTRTAGRGGELHPEHFAWLQEMVGSYPNFFDMLPTVFYQGESLLSPEAARQLEEWFRAGRTYEPGPTDLQAFGWTKGPCDRFGLPPAIVYERYLDGERARRAAEEAAQARRAAGETGDAAPRNAADAQPEVNPAERPAPEGFDEGSPTLTGDEVSEDAPTLTGDEPRGGQPPEELAETIPPPPADEAADAARAETGDADAGAGVGDETVIEPMEVPPPADEVTDAARAETGDADAPNSGGGAAGAAAQAAYDTEKTEQIAEDARPAPPEPEVESGDRADTGAADEVADAARPETGDVDAPNSGGGAAGGAAGETAVAVTGLYELTRVVEPIEIDLTPVGDGEDDPRTQTGDTDPETDGAIDSPAGDPVEDEGEADPTTGAEGADSGDISDGIGGIIDLNLIDASGLLNSSLTDGFEVDANVQAMTTGSFTIDIEPGFDFKRAPETDAVPPRGPNPAIDPRWVSMIDLGDGPELEMIITSLGTSTGEAFQAIVLNRSSLPFQLNAEGLVLEPLEIAEQARQELEGRLLDIAAQNPVTMKLTGYCLQFLRSPPTAGQLFRIAGSQMQELFAPVRQLMGAAEKVKAAGLLNPDSDPRGYFDSITQWAIWSVEQDLDLGSFETSFLEYTKKNVLASGQEWTTDFDDLVRSVVPNRWNDVQQVLTEAERLKAAVPGL
jgi:hypothetical protein